jgi:hypothetical protein
MRTVVNRAWSATRGLALLAGVAVSGAASAEPLTVWLEEEVPGVRDRDKADRQTSGTIHLSLDDVRYPPEPLGEADEQAIADLEAAVQAGEARWEDFEVELPIAAELGLALGEVSVVRDRRDRQAVIELLLFQGVAATRAFEASAFATDQRAAPYRLGSVGGGGSAQSGAPGASPDAPGLTPEDAALPVPWVRAISLAGGAAFSRSDFIDGAAWAAFQRVAGAINALAPAVLELDAGIGQVVIDGEPVAPEATTATLRPGRHWIHVVRDGVVSGRSVIDVAPGARVAMPRRVSDEEVAKVASKVSAGARSGLPDAFTAAMDLVVARYGGEASFVASTDGRRVALVPYGGGARLVDATFATLVLTGELGFGIAAASLFEQGDGASARLAPGMSAGLGLEIGLSYFVLAGGVDATVTVGNTLPYSAGREVVENRSTSVIGQPWGGIGAYALRPTGRKPTLVILGTAQWNAPSHVSFGGRIAVGIPIDDRLTWVRLSMGAGYAPFTTYLAVDDPLALPGGDPSMVTGFFRIGFGGRP